MKVIILAGGFGTRLAEETEMRPKPMVEIGGKPILWHIMRHYARYGFCEFIIALGYRGDVIKRYFLDYHLMNSQMMRVHLKDGALIDASGGVEDWIVTLVDTGLETSTGGRIKRLQTLIGDEPFMVTYGDGVCNVDLQAVLSFHRSHGKRATVTAVRPPARFGGLTLNGDQVANFIEKPQIGEGWINGGFFVFQPSLFDYLKDDSTVLEAHALEQIARDGQLMAYQHDGFWQCMDTLRDKRLLESLWASGQAPWVI